MKRYNILIYESIILFKFYLTFNYFNDLLAKIQIKFSLTR